MHLNASSFTIACREAPARDRIPHCQTLHCPPTALKARFLLAPVSTPQSSVSQRLVEHTTLPMEQIKSLWVSLCVYKDSQSDFDYAQGKHQDWIAIHSKYMNGDSHDRSNIFFYSGYALGNLEHPSCSG